MATRIPFKGADRRETRFKTEQLQGILDAGNNKSEQLQVALSNASNADGPPESIKPAPAPTSIESLPAEITDMIWSNASGPPISKRATSYTTRELDDILTRICLWPEEPFQPGVRARCFARGKMVSFYSLKPPPLAAICHASRQYALGQYGLESDGDRTSQKKRSNNKTRWAYECPLPVVAAFQGTDYISGDAYRLPVAADGRAWTYDEILTLSLPLDVVLRGHDRVILNLQSLWYNCPAPFQGFNIALLDLLLSARDHEIAISVRREVSWHSSTDRCLDRNPSLRDWAHRTCRYVDIDDTAAVRELLRISDCVRSERTTFEGSDTDVANMIVLGKESRAELSRRALKPFQDLWERVNQERIGTSPKDGIIPATAAPPPLRPLPVMDVVVKMRFDYSERKLWYYSNDREEPASMVIQEVTH